MPEITLPYTPRPLQRRLHDLARSHRFLVACCHRQFGKTLFAVNECLDAVLTSPHPRPTGAYTSPFRRQSKDISWQAFKQLCDVIPGTAYNETELRIDLPTGGRIFLAGTENLHALRGHTLDFLVVDEAAQVEESAWTEVLRPTLSSRKGRAVFISTPYGRNWFFDLWQAAERLPDWSRVMFKASDSNVLPPEELASARATMGEDLYQQEYECSWQAVTAASIYGKLIQQARADGRVGHVPHRPGVEVCTGWDFGFRDLTAVWFIQRVGLAYHVVDFLQAAGLSVADYAGMLRERKQQHGYSYNINLAPFDVASSSIQTGRSIQDVALDYGLEFTPVKRGSVAAGISAVRQLLPQMWFDEAKCAEGLDALERYAYEWSQELQMFSMKPEHSRYSHAADALRTYAVGLPEIPEADDGWKPSPTVMTFNVFDHRRGW